VRKKLVAWWRVRERNHIVAIVCITTIIGIRVAAAVPLAGIVRLDRGRLHSYERLVGQLIGRFFGLLQRLVVGAWRG